jgi:hypothetical protein
MYDVGCAALAKYVDPSTGEVNLTAYQAAIRVLDAVMPPAPADAEFTTLAAAVDCDTAETVRWEIAETLDKCAGTKERLLEQIRNGEDCGTCPPGFLAVVMQAEKLARALGVALDLLKVPALPAEVAS